MIKFTLFPKKKKWIYIDDPVRDPFFSGCEYPLHDVDDDFQFNEYDLPEIHECVCGRIPTLKQYTSFLMRDRYENVCVKCSCGIRCNRGFPMYVSHGRNTRETAFNAQVNAINCWNACMSADPDNNCYNCEHVMRSENGFIYGCAQGCCYLQPAYNCSFFDKSNEDGD